MDVKPGDVFKVSMSLWNNNQAYHIAIPFLLEDGSWGMQDTYQIRYHGGTDGKGRYDASADYINKVATDKDLGERSYRLQGIDYYYVNQCKLEGKENYFELLFNVNEYEYVRDSDSYKYPKDDIVRNVKLYNEHGYSWHYGDVGISVKRKDSKILPYLDFMVATSEMVDKSTRPYGSIFYRSNVIEAAKNTLDSRYLSTKECIDEIREGYKRILKNEELIRMSNEFDKFCTDTDDLVKSLSDEDIVRLLKKYVESEERQ